MKGSMFNVKMLLVAIALLCVHARSTAQNAVCVDAANVALDTAGQFSLTATVIDDGSTGFVSMSVSPSSFDCSDVGLNMVTLTVTAANGNSDHCTTEVTVEDKLPPVAICDANIIIQANANGEATLFAADVDEGSFDACGISDYSVRLSNSTSSNWGSSITLTCEDGDQQAVELRVTDPSGNSSVCWSNIEVRGAVPINPANVLVCEANLQIAVSQGQPYSLSIQELLEGGPSGCLADYELEVLDENGNIVPGGLVNFTYIGQMLTAVVTYVPDNSQCWTMVEVLDTGCEPFFICDTEPWNTPSGTCLGGHTLSDGVEWPADITVDDCVYTPEDLSSNPAVSPNDVEPRLFTDTCHIVAMSYSDQVFPTSGDTMTVIRDWTVVDWNSQGTWSYQQTLQIVCGGCTNFYICDTEPWTAPVGDCQSGHTLSDNVEWPADITVNDCYYSPSYLENNTATLIDNVRPQFTPANCPLVALAYQDQVFWIDSTSIDVLRTWSVVEWNSGQVWSYTQELHVDFSSCQTVININTLANVAVPEVNVAPNLTTDRKGKALLTNPAHNLVTPVLQDFTSDGINLLDYTMAREYILQIRDFNPLQAWAADLNENGVVSTLDLVYYERILQNHPDAITEFEWLFLNAEANLTDINDPEIRSVDVGDVFPNEVSFVGVKKGDVTGDGFDGSLLGDGGRLKFVDLVVEDRLLNQGEFYRVDLTVDEIVNVVGEMVELRLDLDMVEIVDISSPAIPNFSDAHYTVHPDGTIRVLWTADDNEHLGGGINANFDTPLLSIELRSKSNGILSGVLTMPQSGVSSRTRYLDPNQYIYVLKWENQIVLTVDPTGLDRQIQVAPNPASDFVNIRISKNNGEDLELRVFDLSGRQLAQQRFTSDVRINTASFDNGLYFYTVTSTSGFWSRGKIAVQH